jgi:hypothetical protein
MAVLSLGVKQPGREADHSPPSAEEKECVALYSTPQYVYMTRCSVKAQDNFYFLTKRIKKNEH